MQSQRYSKIITDTVEQLAAEESLSFMFHKHRAGSGPVPSAQDVKQIVDLCRAIIFPGFYGNTTMDRHLLEYHLGMYTERLFGLLRQQVSAGLCFTMDSDCDCPDSLRIDQQSHADEIAMQFIKWLPQLRVMLADDVCAMYDGDPAATSYGEIISCYPTVRAVSNYRIAHRLRELCVPLLPRVITELAHGETGIDIHPGASIGHHFTIDHGTGVVIGETCVIGNNVKIYQGVTLGAKNFPLDDDGNPIKGIPRHPVIEDDVIIYANATVLGRVTIGRGAVIGGNMWVTHDVAPGAVLIG